MENTTDKNTEQTTQKHPEPSENIQMSIETVTPDTERVKPVEDTLAQEDRDTKAPKNDSEQSSSAEKSDAPSAQQDNDSSAEQDSDSSTEENDAPSVQNDNGIETVTP